MMKNLGPMRLFLIVIAIFLSIISFFTDSASVAENKILIYVSASMMPILFFVMMFDVMMNRIQMADKKDNPELQKIYRTNARIEVYFSVIMVLLWLPFFIRILS